MNGELESLILRGMSLQVDLLNEILGELRAIRKATEQANEPGPDDEPSPFQSLSG